MANISRYRSDPLIPKGLGTNRAINNIRDAIANGTLPCSIMIIKESQRLDHIAYSVYGDGRMWWAIAAASGIGWWLQVPPGTRIRVPTDLERLEELI